MSVISTTVLAFSMSADAFAASIGKGAALKKPKISDALRAGAVFGVVETIMPVLGWLIGLAASSFIASIDHWIAFGLLSLIGGKMIYEGLTEGDEEDDEKQPHNMMGVVLIAIATSIDAMAVGVTLAFLDINIWISALAIGFVTFLMATLGIMTGHYIGSKVGKYAEVLGGVALFCIGAAILCEHLGIV